MYATAYAAIGVLGGLIPDLRIAIPAVVVVAVLGRILAPRLRRRHPG